MANLSVSLLGTFTVILANRPITQFGANKVRALLAYLMVERDRPHPRETLAGLLWPDMPEPSARHNLSQSLHRLRSALGDSQAQVPFIVANRQSIQFNPLCDYVMDVIEFEGLCRSILPPTGAAPLAEGQMSASDIQALIRAVELYRGDFLVQFSISDSDLFEDWMRLKRAQLRQQAFVVLELLVKHFDRRGEYEMAQKYGRQLVILDEFHEDAHRRLMRLLALGGHRDAALRHYDHVRRLWAEEFGVDLEDETISLAGQIQSGSLERPQGRSDTATAIQPLTPAPIPQSKRTSFSRQDWGDAPAVEGFYGREVEVETIQHWIEDEGCRLATIYAIGGQGKTTLAAKVARTLAHHFDFVIWRSLLNAPPPGEILQVWLRFLSGQQLVDGPDSLDEQVNLLFDLLSRRRCLLVLDNLESIMNDSGRAGEYRSGFSGYDQLIRRFGEGDHQGCLLLTSREKPRQFVRMEREGSPVRSLQLGGLEAEASRAILEDAGLNGSPEDIAGLSKRYSGNPLAMILVADTVQELFDADIAAFLRTDSAVFDDIQDVLEQEFGRLSPLELDILYWLAIEREPISLAALTGNLLHANTPGALLAALRSLQRRALLEKREPGFAIQDVVMEYSTQRLVDQVRRELESKELDAMAKHALIKAQAPDYVRQSQERLLLAPVAEWLLNHYGRSGVARHMQWLLRGVQRNPLQARGYAAGNILNLLLYLDIDCRGWDFSGLFVRQAYVRGKALDSVDFRRADLGESVFSDTFNHILSVALSPDGHLLAARTGDEEIRIWELPAGRPYTLFRQEINAVWPVLFTADGNAVVSGRSGSDISVWDLQTKQVRHSLSGHVGQIWAMDLGAHQGILASAGEDRSVRLWDIHTGRQLRVLEGHLATVRAVAFSPDEQILASGDEDGSIRLWDVSSGALVYTLAEQTRGIHALAFSLDGLNLAVGGEEHAIRLWDIASVGTAHVRPVLQLTLQGHTDAVQSIRFRPGSNLLASSSRDGTIRLWDGRSGQTVHVLQGHERQVPSIAFHPNGKRLVSGGWDKTVRVWDAGSGQALLKLIGHKKGICRLVFADDGGTLVSESEDRTLCWWDWAALQRQRKEAIPSVQAGPALLLASSVAIPIRWRQMVSAIDGRPLHFWRSNGRRFRAQEWLHPKLRRSCISPDGQILAEITRGHDLFLRHRQSGETLYQLEGHTDLILAAAFSADGTQLASGSEDRTVRIWDVATGRLLHTLLDHEAGIWAVVFSKDGRFLAGSGGADTTIRLWELASGKLLGQMIGHTNSVFSLAFSPDGTQVASGSEDHSARIWNSSNGEQLHTLEGHTNAVWSVCYAPDDTSLVTGSADETIKVWDTKTGCELGSVAPPGPYAGMQIAGTQGLTSTQRATLKALGAVDE